MGMYDSINLEMNCPRCGNEYLEFQSKEGLCVLDRLNPEEVDYFYTHCDTCDAHITFIRLNQEIVDHLENINKLDLYWKFGDYYYRGKITYELKYNPNKILNRKPAIFREIEDMLANKREV